jgi:HEAT repeat protein
MEAVGALGKIKDKRSLSSLVEALKDFDKHVRYNAVLAIGEFQSQEVLDDLSEVVKNDKEEFVRQIAKDVSDRIKRLKK